MKKFILALFILSFAQVGFTQEIKLDEETKAICNQLMLNVYYDILKKKDEFEELKSFGEKALFQNQHDIYTVLFRLEPSADSSNARKVYEFGLTITDLKDKIFADEGGYFKFEFPLLKVKFAGFLKNTIFKNTHDFFKSVNKYAYLLSDHQQQYLPLKVSVVPAKEVFKPGERIGFEVVITNTSKKNLWLKTLGLDTLFFIYNNKTWRSQQLNSSQDIVSGGKRVIVKPDESLRMKFLGESFTAAQEFEIFCLYRMSMEGVEPYGKLKLKVAE